MDEFDYRTNRTRTSEFLALQFGKITESDFVYTLASTNINQSAPNLVKMYVTIRSWMSLIMDLIELELSELFALEIAKIAEYDFVYTLASTNVDQLVPNMVTKYIWQGVLGCIQLWHKSDSNIFNYVLLIKETLFNLTMFTL